MTTSVRLSNTALVALASVMASGCSIVMTLRENNDSVRASTAAIVANSDIIKQSTAVSAALVPALQGVGEGGGAGGDEVAREPLQSLFGVVPIAFRDGGRLPGEAHLHPFVLLADPLRALSEGPRGAVDSMLPRPPAVATPRIHPPFGAFGHIVSLVSRKPGG